MQSTAENTPVVEQVVHDCDSMYNIFLSVSKDVANSAKRTDKRMERRR
jgi:hypothetical protein